MYTAATRTYAAYERRVACAMLCCHIGLYLQLHTAYRYENKTKARVFAIRMPNAAYPYICAFIYSGICTFLGPKAAFEERGRQRETRVRMATLSRALTHIVIAVHLWQSVLRR